MVCDALRASATCFPADTPALSPALRYLISSSVMASRCSASLPLSSSTWRCVPSSMVGSRAAKAGPIASRAWLYSSAKPRSPVSAKPRAALSAVRTNTFRSAICLSPLMFRSVAAASRRDLVSSRIDAPLMTKRIARLIPRMNRCGRIVLFFLEMGVHHRLLETIIHGSQQRLRRERLAQAAGRAELECHAQEIGRGRVGIGKRVAGHRNQRDIGRALVKYANGFEAAHMRHEDVDDHDIEDARRELAHSRFTTVGNGDFHALPLQADLDGHGDHRIVIDHQYARQRTSFMS